MALRLVGIPANQNEIMQRCGVRHDHGHKSVAQVVLKLTQIVVRENATRGKKLFTVPIIQAEQFAGTSARNNALRISAQHQPFRDATQPLRRLAGEQTANRLGNFHGHHNYNLTLMPTESNPQNLQNAVI